MTKPSSNTVAFLVLNYLMREDYREAVVRRALDYRRQAGSTARRQLESAIRKRVRIKGFSRPLQAPTVYLLKEVVESSYRSNTLMGAILQVWVESHADLQGAVRGFLIARGTSIAEADDLTEGFVSRWTITEMLETTASFREKYLDFDEDDVALMLCLLTGCAPLPDEMVEELAPEEAGKELDECDEKDVPQEEVSTLEWKQWFEELRSLPADPSEWEAMTGFPEAVQQLVEEKRREREATRGKLRQALAALVEQVADQLDYFGLTDVAAWAAEACPLTEAAALAEHVEQLQEALVKHRELRQRPAGSLAKERQQRKELSEMEEEITQAHSRLASVLMPPLPPEKPPPVSGEELPDEVVTPAEPTIPPVSSVEEFAAPEAVEVEAAVAVAEPTVETPSEELAEPSEEKTAPIEEKIAEPTDELAEPEPIPMPLPELRSSQEVATILQTDDCVENWHALLWALIAEDDLPAAYWLARSLVASTHTYVPDWLLAAVQGARWLSFESEAFVHDLLEIAQNYQPASDDVQILIGLSAALRPTLIAPVSGLIGWLKVPDCCPALHDLVTAVSAFASLGIALRPEDLLGVAGAEQRAIALTEATQAAERWLDEAPTRRTKLKRASDVWRRLAKGDLRAMLLPVSEDRRAEVERVRQHLHQWQQHDYVSNRIDQIDRERVKTKFRPIVGPPRQQIIRRVEEACSLANRWCNLVEHEREIEARGKWLFEQVATLRTRVQETLPEVEDVLDKLGDPAQPAPLAAAFYCLRRTLKQLRETLDLSPETAIPESLVVNTWEWLPLDAENLHMALNRRLLWLPEIPLSESGQLPEEALSTITLALRDASAEGRSLRTAFEGWLQKQDYRFVEWLLGALRDETDAAELSRRYQEALDGSRAALRDNIAQTESAIEQAVVDGLIAEERSGYSATVVAMNPEEVLDFPPRLEELLKVRQALSAASQERLAELRTEWQNLQPRLAASHIEAKEQKQVSALVTTALDREDTRVMEECLARLTEALDVGSDLKEDWLVPADRERRDALAEFLDRMRALEDTLSRGLPAVTRIIRDGRELAGLSFGRLPAGWLGEATRTMEAWRRLKQSKAWEPDNADHIETILGFLGFTFESGKGASVRIEQRGTYWLYARVMMSASELLARPIPQFGSQARGYYNVVCVWERPSVDTMSAWLHDLRLDTRTVLVFYLGRMSAARRRFVTRTARERELAMAVLDETLLLFLAGEHRARLPVLLRCALPFAAANPYTPFQAGDVPPEMFFGRDDMARELQRPAGSCLVYGGRQLGKSALLRHVQRQFHHPEREQYAWVEDIKLVGDLSAGQPTDAVWRKLRDKFKEKGLISQRIRTEKSEEIARHIQKAVEEEPNRRVLVLFDEADKFLEADSRDSFRVVERLRTLMLDTQHRFKVILAGLNNVQRFQGIPNQPLAHFGAPLCVGPLEPGAAQQLVRQPLEALGYRFVDDATVLRILSYTNYHPGLIQLFCQELLKQLHKRGGSTMPPYRIEQSEVEAIYRIPDVRERIRERFDWTLALDMRYQAIAWTLIVDQMEMHDSYARAYPPGDILRLVRDWWPQEFGEVDTERLRSLLNEMRGLGVLVRNANGHYRLRSPNLVRLMGTEADIENHLLELSEKHPPVSFDADNHHAPLDDDARRYSPLTHSQERSLNPPQFGVGLVFASDVLGLSTLPEAFRRFVPRELPENVAVFTETPSAITSGERLRNWLDRHMQIHPSHERLIVYHRAKRRPPEDLEDLVREALRFCDRHQSRKRWMRVLFLFDPQATWTWLSLPQNLREDLENRADYVTPHHWNLVGVRQRLEQHGKMDTDKVCQQILQATGGWHYLLENLFDRCGKQDDPRPFTQEIEGELADPNSQLRQEFRHSLGLEENDIACRVLEFVLQEEEVFVDLVAPEWIGGEPALAPEECARAVEYLQRMGCVELRDDILSVETTVRRVMSQP